LKRDEVENNDESQLFHTFQHYSICKQSPPGMVADVPEVSDLIVVVYDFLRRQKDGGTFDAITSRCYQEYDVPMRKWADLDEPGRQAQLGAWAHLREEKLDASRGLCAPLMMFGDEALELLAELARVRSTTSTDSETAIIALMSFSPDALTARHARIVANALQCGGMQDPDQDGMEYADVCLCDGASGLRAAQLFCRLHPTTLVAEALAAQLRDTSSTDHGRSNASTALTQIAILTPSTRSSAVDAITDAMCSASSGLGRFSRGCLLGDLKDLQAVESARRVRKAFKRNPDFLDRMVCGGYTEYLKACQLNVDPNDARVKYERDDGLELLLPPELQTPEKKAELFSKARARAHQESQDYAERANALGLPPVKARFCAQCQSQEDEDERRYQACGGCQGPLYCSRACQKIHWKAGHKNTCTRPGS
jgi:hypothetical protein